MQAPTFPTAGRNSPAGILLPGVAGRPVANVGNPAYAVAAFLMLTLLPYLVPMEYMEIVKMVGPLEHLLTCLVLAGLLLGAYALYAALLDPRFDPRPERLEAPFRDTLYLFTRILIWVAVVANIGILAWCIPHYSGSIFSMKAAMADLGGVNILSQSYLFAIGPFLYLSLARQRPYRRELLWLAVVLAVRAFLLAERLALMEFAVVALVSLAVLRQMLIPLTRLVLIGVAVPVLFVTAEIFRSFYAKFVRDTGWGHLDLGFILQWNLERLALYYTDVTNKFYFMLKEQYFYTTEFYLRGLRSIGARFGLAEEEAPSQINILIEQYDVGNEEMTNPGGLAVLMSDFGWWGTGVLALLVTLLFLTHLRASRGHLVSLAVYPVLFLTVVELPRFVYLYSSRCITPFVLFLLAWIGARLISQGARFQPAAPAPAAPGSLGA
ncbi:hypothetical protein [Rhodocista pekingensis]|uniref:Oligosaccharide repeat unit polymerase n=1 Tax=Rhodocista pekingensis TaxID=201185 RepID=A0ABW2KXI8_9PROT